MSIEQISCRWKPRTDANRVSYGYRVNARAGMSCGGEVRGLHGATTRLGMWRRSSAGKSYTVKRKMNNFTPEYLGKRSTEPITTVDRIPWAGGAIKVELVCAEFTSLCPITGQPDFGVITVRFVPVNWIVETKSLKLYLWRFRQRGSFSEQLVAEIADDLFSQLSPKWLEVDGTFNSRGGISIHAIAFRGDRA